MIAVTLTFPWWAPLAVGLLWVVFCLLVLAGPQELWRWLAQRRRRWARELYGGDR